MKKEYLAQVESGILQKDPDQLKIVEILESLSENIAKDGILEDIKGLFKKSTNSLEGVYIYGGVGRGKTMLMDLFFDSVRTEKKIRQHFHRFMQSIHARLTELSGKTDPLSLVVSELERDYDLICFDEFYVEDIADAMLLGRSLEKLLASKVKMVFTSNIKPNDLYMGGLQRKSFLSAISAIENHCEVVCLESVTDYRLRELEKSGIYFSPIDSEKINSFNELFLQLSKATNSGPDAIDILDRKIAFEDSANDIIHFSADVIFNSPRSSSDYIELSREFHTIFISNLDVIEEEDTARRFIAFIDECYDRNVKVIFLSNPLPNEIYTGTRLADKFQRTLSRLTEMQSNDYLQGRHKG
ncbi:MAG: cell division protein ZapE [Candidatus Actinomarina sp.]